MTTFSKMAERDAIEAKKKEQNTFPPPVPYVKPAKKEEDEEKRKERLVELTFRVDNDDIDSTTYKEKIERFENGTPEDWVNFRRRVDGVFERMNVTDDYVRQNELYLMLFRGTALEYYRTSLDQYSQENDAKPVGERVGRDVLVKMAVNHVARKTAFRSANWQRAAKIQKRYLRHGLWMHGKEPAEFRQRLEEMNDGIVYYPVPDERIQDPWNKLDEEELIDSMSHCKPIEWHLKLIEQGRSPDDFTSLDELEQCLTLFYTAEKAAKALEDGTRGNKRKNGGDDRTDKKKKNNSAGKQGKSKRTKACKYCNGWHVAPDEKCWKKEGNSTPPNKKKRSKDEVERVFTATQVGDMLAKVTANLSTEPVQKRQVKEISNMLKETEITPPSDSDIDSMNTNSSDN